MREVFDVLLGTPLPVRDNAEGSAKYVPCRLCEKVGSRVGQRDG